MFFAQVIIVLLAMAIVIGLLLYFFQKNKKIGAVHTQQLFLLKEEIMRHTSQVNFRNKSLDKYHFLTYNLEEALVIQAEIKI